MLLSFKNAMPAKYYFLIHKISLAHNHWTLFQIRYGRKNLYKYIYIYSIYVHILGYFYI